MGIFTVHYHLWLFFCFTISYAQIAQTPLLSPSPPPFRLKESPFRPSIAVVVGLLTTIFSITFLLLLYAKHCKRAPFETPTSGGGYPPPSSFRRNSGIDRTVIESLPVFRFGSLVGQKAEGLECAVCLNKFESSEILRLLPKCKHAFHVECVDTWLDAHSTCPLCRYQVHPEDILLENGPPLLESKYNNNHIPIKIPHLVSGEGGLLERKSFSSSAPSPVKVKERSYSPAGRHSSAGERGTSSSLQIIVEAPNEKDTKTTSFLNTRMSLDSWNFYRKKFKRKDGLLLSAPGKSDVAAEEPQQQRRLEHRVIISEATSTSGAQYRWSDVEASDMLFLRSEMIISESRRYRKWTGKMEDHGSGKGVINERSVSEMTGVSRFRSNEDQQRQRKGAAVTRWLAWMSQSQSEIAASTSAT